MAQETIVRLLDDIDGKPADETQNVNAAAYTIHTAVFEARPEVNAVMHVHSPSGMVLSGDGCCSSMSALASTYFWAC